MIGKSIRNPQPVETKNMRAETSSINQPLTGEDIFQTQNSFNTLNQQLLPFAPNQINQLRESYGLPTDPKEKDEELIGSALMRFKTENLTQFLKQNQDT